jgi:hypothetical protein
MKFWTLARHNTLRPLILSVLGILLFSSIGCQKKTEQAALDTTIASVPPLPISVSIQLLHTDSTTADSIHPFTARDTVHAVIHTENATDTSIIHASWRYVQKNATIAENEEHLSAGTNDTHFDLMNAKLWPIGAYDLLVDVDGHRDSIRFPIVGVPKR